jgi:predicted DNA-binding antitoxin AbrB/MazE fold protein
MSDRVEAIYEGGVFRPTEPVALQEGSRVRLQFEQAPPQPDAKPLGDLLDMIASLPPEGPNDGFSGADHDKILYGGDEGAR